MCSPGTAATRLGSAEELIDDQADRKLGDLRLEQQDHGGADRRPNANLVDALGAGSMGQLVLLVPPSTPPASVLAWLERTPTITTLKVVGGIGAVPNVAVQGMRNAGVGGGSDG